MRAKTRVSGTVARLPQARQTGVARLEGVGGPAPRGALDAGSARRPLTGTGVHATIGA